MEQQTLAMESFKEADHELRHFRARLGDLLKMLESIQNHEGMLKENAELGIKITKTLDFLVGTVAQLEPSLRGIVEQTESASQELQGKLEQGLTNSIKKATTLAGELGEGIDRTHNTVRTLSEDISHVANLVRGMGERVRGMGGRNHHGVTREEFLSLESRLIAVEQGLGRLSETSHRLEKMVSSLNSLEERFVRFADKRTNRLEGSLWLFILIVLFFQVYNTCFGR